MSHFVAFCFIMFAQLFAKLFAQLFAQLRLHFLTMVTINIYLDRRRSKADGSCPLKLSVTFNRQVRYVALGIDLQPAMWNAMTCRVSPRHRQARELNSWIARCRVNAEDAVLELTTSSRRVASLKISDYVAAVSAKINGKPALQAETFAARLVRFASSADKKKSTRQLYLSTLARIRAFTPDADSLLFEDITKDWLVAFDAFLAQTAPSKNYRNIHLRNIRAVFNSAIDDEVTSAYPFRRFKIRPVATPKRSLSVERLRELFSFPAEPYAEKYVDFFKLIFFLCGINVIDLCNLHTIVDGRVEYHRAKTGRFYSIKVEPEARAIIEKYRGRSFLLDVLDRFTDHRNFTKRMNTALQRIGQMERKGRGGKKIITPAFPGLSSYWARHTWATIAASLDIPKETIAAALGHGGNSVTDIYIDFDQRKVDEANRKVLDWVLYNKK